ncbi:MAG: glutamine--fructose-6-phosphate transaminase (isomerizing) [Neomegalonema sp.]|nr:glutamine--fructose-6-phosphate transaminase (isomerizing) [Neomegalonema sp.]
MCGIIGVIARGEAAPLMLDALKRLEYRGYDSAGIATLKGGVIDRRRAVGKLDSLFKTVALEPIEGRVGIGHTRWATHGAPTVANAHPHATDRVAVVHNGIIENFRDLRDELIAKGRTFTSETDTEVVAQLCTEFLDQGMSPADAVSATFARLRGAFALCFLFKGTADLIIAARKGSPLAIGYGDGEMFVGSDAIALSPLTNRICYLEEGDWAAVTRDGATIFNRDGLPANREIKVIPVASAKVDKGDHRHFMAKEIHEQPAVAGYTLTHFSPAGSESVAAIDGLDFTKIDTLNIVACGTASYAGAVAKYWFESLARLPVNVDVASEFRYRDAPNVPNSAALFISQSGETADTLAALRHAKARGDMILSVVNVPTSSIARESDIAIPTQAGPEIGVASTKAFTCQLIALFCLSLLAGRQRGTISPERETELLGMMREMPTLMSEVLRSEGLIAGISSNLSTAQDILYLGRGPMFPLALEAALKLKEISYIHAEGFASGELKHGVIALVDDKVPVVTLAPRDALFEKTISNMQEVMARGGKIVLISDASGVEEAGEGVWRSIALPEVDPLLAPILYALPVQLLAYHTAVHKGTDVDQPRNLAKSVTVE